MSPHEIRLRGPWTVWHHGDGDNEPGSHGSPQRISMKGDPAWQSQIVALAEPGTLVMERRFQWPRAGDATATVTLCVYGGHRWWWNLNGERVEPVAEAVVQKPHAAEVTGDAVPPAQPVWVADVTPLLRQSNLLRISLDIAEATDVASLVFDEVLLRIAEPGV